MKQNNNIRNVEEQSGYVYDNNSVETTYIHSLPNICENDDV